MTVSMYSRISADLPGYSKGNKFWLNVHTYGNLDSNVVGSTFWNEEKYVKLPVEDCLRIRLGGVEMNGVTLNLYVEKNKKKLVL